MFRALSGQTIDVFAFDYSTGAPKTGLSDITVYLSKDDGTLTSLTDTTATEVSSTNSPGWYRFDVSQTETDADKLLFTGKSSTSNVAILCGPARYTLQTVKRANGPVTWYVQSTGSDSNTGLVRTAPFATLSAAASAVRNGDTVHVIGSITSIASFPSTFANRRIKLTGDRSNNATITISGGGGVVPANGTEICYLKIVNSNTSSGAKCIDLANVSNVYIHDVILDAGTGDVCVNINNSPGTRLERVYAESSTATGGEGYCVDVAENTAGTGGSTTLHVKDCWLSGKKAAIHIDDRVPVTIENSTLVATYTSTAYKFVSSVVFDKHDNAGATARLLNNHYRATTTHANYSGTTAAITSWINGAGESDSDVATFNADIRGGWVEVTAAAGTTKHFDVHNSGSVCKVRSCNHDTTKNGTYVQVVDTNAASDIADGVWDEPRSGHTTSDTFGKYVDAQISTVTGGTTVSAANVDKDHTWQFDSPAQVTSPRVLQELIGFVGLLSMDFTEPLPSRSAINTVSSATFANISGTEPTVTSATVTANKKGVNILIDASSATANTYTLSVTVVTTDSQTFVRKGRITLT